MYINLRVIDLTVFSYSPSPNARENSAKHIKNKALNCLFLFLSLLPVGEKLFFGYKARFQIQIVYSPNLTASKGGNNKYTNTNN